MSLSNDFNSRIKIAKPNEVDLFRTLTDSLRYKGVSVKEFHGCKGIVEFDINHLGSTFQKRCEICDLLLVFIHPEEIRFTFLQNKYTRRFIAANIIPKVNASQHYLLSTRPIFNPLFTGLPNNILNDALIDGAGSFGNFYFNGKSFDMSYFVATSLKPTSKLTKLCLHKGYNRKYISTTVPYPALIYNHLFFEAAFCENLDDFESASSKMLIGSPAYNDNVKGYLINISKYIINNLDKNKLENIERDKISNIKNSLNLLSKNTNFSYDYEKYKQISESTILFDCSSAIIKERTAIAILDGLR